MAEENTTDSTPTPTEQTAPPTDSSTSSTTAPAPADDEAAPGTLLTSGAEPKADEPDTRTDEEKAAEASRATLFGVPEGEYKVDGLPEGTVIDDKAMAAVTPLAKELGLSNEGFSKLANVYASEVLPGVVEKYNDDLQREVVAQHAAWGQETVELIKTDPVFKGSQLKDVQQVAAKTLDRFGGDKFRSFLDETGLGNHPDMVRFAYLAGTAISEDTTFERGGAVSEPKSRVDKYYGSTKE